MYEKDKTYQLTCRYCGSNFESRTHNRTYCERRECKEKAFAAKRERIRRTMRHIRNMRKRKAGK